MAKCGSTTDTSLCVWIRENRSPKSGQITEIVKKLPTTNPTKRQIAATFTTVASEQIILIEKFTFSF
ncbi:hypothetical protein GCM10010178_24570 [Lentzea flava]|uniref:Uncharacterized protein n=1 Tax=Lentzea flava TaxID=103732 RepID=A0ABQ2UFW7_9PSEU|nr:hypothetical protein GCM10010178_24570 [Lentzea flava]